MQFTTFLEDVVAKLCKKIHCAPSHGIAKEKFKMRYLPRDAAILARPWDCNSLDKIVLQSFLR